jgi:integrase
MSQRGQNRLSRLIPVVSGLPQEADVKMVAAFLGLGPKAEVTPLLPEHRLDERMKIPHWRLHDLRRTAATGMAGIGISPHIVEAALNHVSGFRAGVAGTYNRYNYANEKRAALERWALHVQGTVSGHSAAVVNLRERVRK